MPQSGPKSQKSEYAPYGSFTFVKFDLSLCHEEWLHACATYVCSRSKVVHHETAQGAHLMTALAACCTRAKNCGTVSSSRSQSSRPCIGGSHASASKVACKNPYAYCLIVKLDLLELLQLCDDRTCGWRTMRQGQAAPVSLTVMRTPVQFSSPRPSTVTSMSTNAGRASAARRPSQVSGLNTSGQFLCR